MISRFLIGHWPIFKFCSLLGEIIMEETIKRFVQGIVLHTVGYAPLRSHWIADIILILHPYKSNTHNRLQMIRVSSNVSNKFILRIYRYYRVHLSHASHCYKLLWTIPSCRIMTIITNIKCQTSLTYTQIEQDLCSASWCLWSGKALGGTGAGQSLCWRHPRPSGAAFFVFFK